MTQSNPPSIESVTFGLITHPAKHAWPAHGCFMLTMPDKTSLESKPMFSVEACREYIKEGMEAGALNGDQAGELDQAVIATVLPRELTRYDMLSKHFPVRLAYLLINRFCGQTPPEPGSGAARFELCEDGRYCGQSSCKSLPSHAALFVEGLASQIGTIRFSRQGAEIQLTQSMETGLLTPEEANGIRSFTDSLSMTTCAEQADRFTGSIGREYWFDHLDVIFGLRQPDKPARFAPCCAECSHLHFFPYDDGELGMGVNSVFDAKHLIAEAEKTGLISQDTANHLHEEANKLNLPEGCEEESIYLNPCYHEAATFLQDLLNEFKRVSHQG